MNDYKMLILAVRGLIAELEAEKQATVLDCINQIEDVIARHGDLAVLACTLIGAKLQALDDTGLLGYVPEKKIIRSV